MDKIRERSEIPVADKWAVEDLYTNNEAWEQELSTIAQDKVFLAGFAGHLAESGQSLYDYLYRSEMTDVKASRLGNYCMRKSDEDTRNAIYQAMTGRFTSVMVDLSSALSFDTPEIMAAKAKKHVEAGFDTIKTKVGTSFAEDLARVKAIREAVGDDVKIRIDANQAWSAKEAVRLIERLNEYTPEEIWEAFSRFSVYDKLFCILSCIKFILFCKTISRIGNECVGYRYKMSRQKRRQISFNRGL